MRIGKVVGQVTLNRAHASLAGGALRLVMPLSLEQLRDPERAISEELVVYDALSAGHGSLIAFSEGGEAAQPFYPEMKPIDAYNAAILDRIDLDKPAR